MKGESMNEIGSVREKPEPEKGQTGRSTKYLKSATAVKTHQKDWFNNVRERISNGEPFALCNADEAEEIFLTMGIPVIVKQWWAGIISAKRLSSHYFDLLAERGYDICRYCALGLGCAMDNNPELAPWGGLPPPSIIIGTTDCDAGQRVTELWARECGAHLFPIEVTSPTMPYTRWWERIKDHWDEIIEPHRLDMRVEELKELIRFLEVTTGKTFTMARLYEIMELSNRQNEYFRKARDLIADTYPCPVSLSDQTSVYPAQWHRGTQAGLDLTKMFYEEVKEKVDKGEAACPNEKLRLMWVGVGLWSNTAFYQYFEEKYGAVFNSSMYLSIGADGYQRRILNNDPLRAVASRHVFLGLNDNDWYVKEAKRHRVNGAVQLVSRNCKMAIGTRLTHMAFENAGIPILSIYADNVDAREWDDSKIKTLVSRFIEERLL
jgi:benzoyl-CoA reductase/2-hydroxyglutaryl-CoA dehydratase subunit BcrC/BadD/HgdB